jgi:glutathione synthase/RimK-type ligase-like ATP-grasp enzyme
MATVPFLHSSKTPPAVLIITSGAWVSTARLSLALKSFGCNIGLHAPVSHPAFSTDVASFRSHYNALIPRAGVLRALRNFQPDFVIAADELMVLLLEEIWQAEPAGSPLRALIQRSIGGEKTMLAARSRMELARVASRLDVPTPDTVELEHPRDVQAAIRELGLPLVMKADATSGGRGVRILDDAARGTAEWRRLRGPLSLARAGSRGLQYREWNHMRTWARRELRGVTAQRFITGQERNAMALCVDGKVMACTLLEVVQTWCERGPSSVLRIIDDPAMQSAIEKTAAALGVTGFCGFDFMVEEGTGRCLLLEMNPRPTQLAHLALGPGRDLVAAYLRGVVGLEYVRDREAATYGDTIALFPQELQRDEESELLTRAFHDVPWDQPRLIERVLGRIPQVVRMDRRWAGVKSA